MTPRYNARETEAKWQRHWEANKSFASSCGSPQAIAQDPAQQQSASQDDKTYYVLEMFPYPSGNIHMGHVRNYTLGDVIARARRMQGYDVLHPMGWDAFGLPAENAAIERGAHPEDWTLKNVETMREQLKLIGLSYDWSRELATCLPEYYQHELLFFLKFLEAGLAYRKEAEVNWDPVDNTVLANEQVVEGRGWRSGALVERRKLSQWFLRISDFAEDLLAGLETLKEWPDKVRIMQEKWIGKSSGCLLRLQVASHQLPVASEELEIYTTRPDTIFGMSFCAISPGHPLATELATSNQQLTTFISECNRLGTSEEAIEKAEKKGFDTGLKIIHPFDGREVPLYVANFVLMDYGTGAIFGCPAHDARDFEFATKYNLPIVQVVRHPASAKGAAQDPVIQAQDPVQPRSGSQDDALPYLGDGILINSDFLNGLSVDEAKKKAILALSKIGIGEEKINYRLRDWGISRQRYWGCPIPVIHCKDCGVVPVPEQDLPVVLPKDVTFDKPGNPLARHPSWKHVPCPACGKPAERETDTFDTFFESSWYFARFATLPSAQPLEAGAVKKWLPVDCYIGGIEHAVLHLLYSRFFMRALIHCGLIEEPEPSASEAAPHVSDQRSRSGGTSLKEPFKRLETQGMICHETYKSEDGRWLSPEEVGIRDQALGIREENTNRQSLMPNALMELATGRPVTVGRIEKMSKSKKNTVDPRHIIESYGADAARLFMLSDSPPDRDLEWTDAGIEGAWRYIQRVWRLVSSLQSPVASTDISDDLKRKTHQTIAQVTDDIEKFHFNKAIARIRELTNMIEGADGDRREALEAALHLLCPFLPHLAEECWQQLGHKDELSSRPWPKADLAFLTQDEVTVAIQINGKTRTTIQLAKDLPKEQAEAKVMELQTVRDALKDKQVKKIIVVANRIVNVVAG